TLRSSDVLRVPRHEVDAGRIAYPAQRLCNVLDYTLVVVVADPLAEIVQAARVPGELTVTVADPAQLVLEAAVRRLARSDRARHREHVLDVRHAVELAQVDHQLLRLRHLEQPGRIGRADEALPDRRDQ